jgi:hypothetical protein
LESPRSQRKLNLPARECNNCSRVQAARAGAESRPDERAGRHAHLY